MGFLTGKKLLITGVLSNRSIAYGIAKACHEQVAELAFSPARLTLTEQSDRPYLTQELKAEFSVPLEKTEVTHAR